jgi:hypothetical protein
MGGASLSVDSSSARAAHAAGGSGLESVLDGALVAGAMGEGQKDSGKRSPLSVNNWEVSYGFRPMLVCFSPFSTPFKAMRSRQSAPLTGTLLYSPIQATQPSPRRGKQRISICSVGCAGCKVGEMK